MTRETSCHLPTWKVIFCATVQSGIQLLFQKHLLCTFVSYLWNDFCTYFWAFLLLVLWKIAAQKVTLYSHCLHISIIWFIFCRWPLPLSPGASIGFTSTFTGWRSRVPHSHSGSEKTSGKPGNRRPTFSKLTEKFRGRKKCLFCGWRIPFFSSCSSS